MTLQSKKSLKIITGIILLLTLPSLIFLGYVFFKYNDNVPTGVSGEKADMLAQKMLNSLNYEAYKNTNYIEWDFKNRHLYKWNKKDSICEVYWKEFRVTLNFNNPELSKAYIHSFKVENEIAKELKEKALKYFYNDTFWLTAPYSVFNKNANRKFVDNNTLLVTYNSSYGTPDGSYLWKLDETGKPIGFKIWASIFPINGLEATWRDWITTETGAMLPTFHKVLFFGLEMDIIETSI